MHTHILMQSHIVRILQKSLIRHVATKENQCVPIRIRPVGQNIAFLSILLQKFCI